MTMYGEKIIQTFFIFILVFCYGGSVDAVTFTVTKTTDSYPIGQIGELRWAIQRNNRTPGPNRISFDIPGEGPFTIKPLRDLDIITTPVLIDGYSQPGAIINSQAAGSNAELKIIINGNNYKTGNAYRGSGNGLVFGSGSGGSMVRGLVINEWVNTGIFLYKAHNVSICGNFIGTDVTGEEQRANQAGIFLGGSDSVKIGTPELADRNVIAGSFFYFNASACVAAVECSFAEIKNNYIGTNKGGDAALGNSLVGVECIACDSVTIGGPKNPERNIISGHTVMGISFNIVTSSLVQNNYLGCDVTGKSLLGAGNIGIALSGRGVRNSTSNNMIIGNVLVGHQVGIQLGFTGHVGANKNICKRNFIGVNTSGNKALPNRYGIVVSDGFNAIGTVNLSSGNVISGNSESGIKLFGLAQATTIQGNFIGLSGAGSEIILNGIGIEYTKSANAPAGEVLKENFFGDGNTLSMICS